VSLGPDGVSDFFALHAALARQHAPAAQLVAFDLLHLDGEDLRDRPIAERRAKLGDLIGGAGLPIQFSHEVEGDGPDVLRAARQHGPEGGREEAARIALMDRDSKCSCW
jgi:bifunctional non-homologous end joining protein LigD